MKKYKDLTRTEKRNGWIGLVAILLLGVAFHKESPPPQPKSQKELDGDAFLWCLRYHPPSWTGEAGEAIWAAQQDEAGRQGRLRPACNDAEFDNIRKAQVSENEQRRKIYDEWLQKHPSGN